MTEDPEVVVRATERWLDDHGLPWFVGRQGAAVRRRLTRGHLVRVGSVAVVLAVANVDTHHSFPRPAGPLVLSR